MSVILPALFILSIIHILSNLYVSISLPYHVLLKHIYTPSFYTHQTAKHSNYLPTPGASIPLPLLWYGSSENLPYWLPTLEDKIGGLGKQLKNKNNSIKRIKAV